MKRPSPYEFSAEIFFSDVIRCQKHDKRLITIGTQSDELCVCPEDRSHMNRLKRDVDYDSKSALSNFQAKVENNIETYWNFYVVHQMKTI